MLNLIGKATARDCEGTSRRDFLRIGALGLTALSLPGLLRLRSAAAATGRMTKDTSVIWLWLGGGPTHIETFDPKMEAPVEYRSVVGAVQTSVPGVQIGGLFPEMAKAARRMAFVRSFTHGNSGHAGGTHFAAVRRPSSPPLVPSRHEREEPTSRGPASRPIFALPGSMQMVRAGWARRTPLLMSAGRRGTT